MKRIAIISSYAWIRMANNYGALLQYFALQQYFSKKGYYAFWMKFIINRGLISKIKTLIKQIIKSPIICISSIRCHKSFMSFCKDYLNMTDEIFSYGNSNIRYPNADYFITGSDQVWGGTLQENFLTFVDDSHKKIAYAVSFGKDCITDEHRRIISPWVNDFNKISVREKSGLDICKSICGNRIEIQVLLDPTFLIAEQSYPHIKLEMSERFIFLYVLNLRSKDSIRFNEILGFSSLIGARLKVCAVQGAQYIFNKHDLVFPSPIEWLSYYRQSECIITNTFHGTVFAIIHRKQFLCILQNGESALQNTRMLSLLGVLGLEERILNPESKINEAMKAPISWEVVYDKIDSLRKKTDDFFSFLDN